MALSPTTLNRPVEKKSSLRDSPWNVIVWNDPVTLMSYVVLVFRKLFGYDTDQATSLMLQVHKQGKAVVATQPREQAEMSAAQLHSFGLQATVGKD